MACSYAAGATALRPVPRKAGLVAEAHRPANAENLRSGRPGSATTSSQNPTATETAPIAPKRQPVAVRDAPVSSTDPDTPILRS